MAERSLKILVVDDDRLIVTMVSDILRQLGGYDVVTAASAKEALAHDLDALDGILCDFHMPEMNGADLLEFLREGRKYHGRFAFITAHGDDPELVKAARHYGAKVLPKPVRPDAIAKLMAELFGERS